jgi:homospermidine synthase
MIQSMTPHALVLIGYGAVGEVVVRAARDAWGMDAGRFIVFEADEAAAGKAKGQGLSVLRVKIDQSNFEEILSPKLGPSAVLVNLGIAVQSQDLIILCAKLGAIYVDAGIDLWAPHDTLLSLGAQRAHMLEVVGKKRGSPTAVVGHGANPGLVSHWAKKGLELLAEEHGLTERWEQQGSAWSWLARALGLRVIQVAERDHGVFEGPEGVFCNTWSVDGLAKEALVPGESGWGSHEGPIPLGARLEYSAGTACVSLATAGHSSWVKTWTPLGGPSVGLAITHLESIGLAACLSDGKGYAPTCYFAYQPCRQALDGLARLRQGLWSIGDPAWIPSGSQVDGVDELGVLLLGERFGSLWVGSRLDSAQARAKVEGASATTLQVAAGILSAIEWALSHPDMGLMEPEDLPHAWMLERAESWIGAACFERSFAIEPLDLPAPARPEDLRFARFLAKSPH